MILIADSGATKTEWLLTGSGEAAQTIHTVGLNPYFLNTEAIAMVLRNQLLPATGGGNIQTVYYYGTGCNSPASCAIVAGAIRAVWPAVQTVEVDSDMLGAARAACGNEPGIVSILGTGSNACRYDGRQITSPSYSLGFWLGDEGSGGYLGKRLVVNFLHEKLPQELHQRFAEQYQLNRVMVLENAYQKPSPNRYFASFAPFLSENRAHPYVQDLIKQAFRTFLELYVGKFPESAVWPVHFIGSVAYYFQDLLREVATERQMTLGRMLKAPMESLARYHQENA
ncbi:ATPase [Nibrella saemangeumensis]|uniref:ATPase n=1 Tax=Nibrella saemangeumensis TaxID=1084526 RepID=A0ABP8NJ95_9BACT